MAKSKERPKWVERAVLKDDLATLRFAAEKSNEVQAKKREDRKAEDTFYRERKVERDSREAIRRADETNEHIVPINPEDHEEDVG